MGQLADFKKIQLDEFSDHELEVPEMLFHFPLIANAVSEKGRDQGFLYLAVNRDPKDNKPHNVRNMEMHMALAHFYTAERPWNPHRGDPVVRVRLEAMLDRWTRIQNSDGRYAEYSPDNRSLAPTGFGTKAAARTLDLLIEAPGQQAYGLGLLWNPAFGPAMQSLPKCPDRWGTMMGKSTTSVEQGDLNARFLLGGKVIAPVEGARDLPEGELEIQYALGKGGDKQIHFTNDSITVRITSPGTFQEILPLLCGKESAVEVIGNQFQILQHAVLFRVQVAARDAKIQLSKAFDLHEAGLQRQQAIIRARDRLTYQISFMTPASNNKPSAP